jgi:hypothetical protein
MRRRTETEPSDELQLPEHLRVCWVEDWASPDEYSPYAEDPVSGRALTAWRRCKDARKAWYAEHGMSPLDGRSRYPALPAPRWRRWASERTSDG